MPHDDLDNYNVDFDENPFDSPPPEGASKKRKEPDSGLGIDQEVSIQKRPRVPNIKLDEERLLGPMGIPKLKSRAAGLKLKGKGHEFSDAARLLSFYQLWLDDLFPKARFLDALAMVEKAGHKKKLQIARQEWISQGKPKDREEDDEQDQPEEDNTAPQNGGIEVQDGTSQPATQRHSTPVRDDVPEDDDLYGATPIISRIKAPREDVPDQDDDLEALMAETELQDTTQPNPVPHQTPTPDGGGQEDDLDALIAEAEAQDQDRAVSNQDSAAAARDENYADDEEAMREMEGW